MTDDQISTNDRIQVLLVEYAALRAEITQRGWWQIQMSTFGGMLAIAIFGYMVAHHNGYAGILLVFLTAILAGIGLIHNLRGIRAAGIRLCLLEEKINTLAGEELLTRQFQNGSLSVGYRERLRRLFAGMP
jgi:hypothetical protein